MAKLVIYTLCALTALSCALLLLRGYWHSRRRVLLWSGLCFAGMTVTNVLLILDKTVFAAIDLSTWRLSVALISLVVLVAGLLLEREA